MIDDAVVTPTPTTNTVPNVAQPTSAATDTDIHEEKLLRLQVTVGNPQGLLPDIATFLGELIGCNLGENGGNNYIKTPYFGESEPQDLLLQVVDKRTPESTKVLYLTDVYSLAEDILGFLQRNYASSPAVIELLQSSSFSRGMLEDIKLDNGLISEVKAFERRRELYQQLQELSLVIDSLLSSAQAEAETTLGSVREPAMAAIQQQPLSSWDLLIKDLAEAYRLLEENSTVVVLTQQLAEIEPGNYIAGDFPLVFNTFSLTVSRVALLAENQNKLKPETVARLRAVEQQDFYFSGVAENDPNIALKRKLPSHALITQRFISFFDTEVIPYLEGAKKLEIPATEVAAESPADSNANEPLPQIETTKVSREQLITEIKKVVAQQALQELQVNQLVLENRQDLEFLKQVSDRVTQVILDNLSPDLIQNSIERVTDQAVAAGINFYDSVTDTFITGPATENYVSQLAQLITQEFLALGILTPEALIEIIGQTSVDDFVTKTNPPIPTQSAQVPISRQLPALAVNTDLNPQEWQQLSGPEQIAILQKSNEWWAELSLDRRQQVLSLTQFPISFDTVIQSVSFDTIRDYLAQSSTDATTQAYFRGLSPDLVAQSRFYAQLQADISFYLLTQLSAQELFSLFYSSDRVRVWSRILAQSQTALKQSRSFQAYITDLTNQFDQQLILESRSFLANEVDVLRFEQNIDAIFVLVKNPEAFITSLDQQGVEKYFGITLKSELELALFKKVTLKRLALRKGTHSTAGLLEISDDIDEYLPQIRNLSRTLPRGGLAVLFTETYDEGLDEDAQKQLDATELDHYKQVAQAKRAFLEQLWASLDKAEKQAVYAQMGLPAAPGSSYVAVPRGLRMQNVFEQFSQRSTAKAQGGLLGSLSRFIPSFLNPKKKLDPTKQFFNAVESAGVAAAATAMNAAIPLSGTVFQTAHKVAQFLGIDTKKVLAGLGILTAGLIALIAKSLTTVMGWLGGITGGIGGFFIGGPAGALLGASTGSIGGYLLGEATGINTINLSKAIGDTAKWLFGTPSVTAAAPLLPAAVPGVVMVCIAGATIYVQSVVQGAFLNPLPTVGDGEISPYVEIQKVSVEGTHFETPTDITYAIRIKAKEGYSITITETPTDDFDVRVNHKGDHNNATNPTEIPLSPEYLIFHGALNQYVGQTVDATNYLELGTYKVPFGSEPGENDYNDANILNKFGLTFTVTATHPNSTLPEDGGPQTAVASEVICFGECPQETGGCWPTTGAITQMPFGPDSHARLQDDAYDIASVVDRAKIYSPFGGKVYLKNDPGGYGVYVRLDADNGRSFVFGHMQGYATGLSDQATVEPGTLLGYMGNSGYIIPIEGGSGIHLHYEIDQNGEFGEGSPPSQLTPIVPEPEKGVGDGVRSCYDP